MERSIFLGIRVLLGKLTAFRSQKEQVRVPAAKLKGLSSSPSTHMEDRTDSHTQIAATITKVKTK